jgi:phosphoglucomutase
VKPFKARTIPVPSDDAGFDPVTDFRSVKSCRAFQVDPVLSEHFLDIRSLYLDHVAATVRLDLIKRARMRIIVDNVFGTSRDYLDRLLVDRGIEITAIHNYSDSSFGGVIPTCSQSNLRELARLVAGQGADIGLATDIGGDRFGIIDPRGRLVDAHLIMPLLVEYLITVRKMGGDIVKSVSASDQITRVAERYQRKVHETPVGFKFLADMLLTHNAFIGIEGNNGAALKGPAPCRDGILFSLLVCEMLAHFRLSLPQLLSRFARRFPPLLNRETQVARSARRRDRLVSLLQEKNFAFPGLHLQRLKFIDGVKFIFSDSWLLLRESGTSNVIRITAEAPNLRQVQRLLQTGRHLLD